MTHKLSRRRLLQLAAVSGTSSLIAACTTLPAVPPGAAPGPTPTIAESNLDPAAASASNAGSSLYPESAPLPEAPTLAARMAKATTNLLDSLGDLRAQATFAFDDAERVRWHWTTPSGFPRNGLPLKAMNQEQASFAFALLRTGLSEVGYQQARSIMALQVDLGNDPQLFYLSVFGAPGGDAPWGWRWEGHHLSRHFTVLGEQVVMTPFFLGSWPTETDSGFRAMPREEDAAREIVLSLDAAKRSQVIFQEHSLTRHETQNQATVAPLAEVGLPLGEFAAEQQALVDEIVRSYLNTLPSEIGDPIYTRLQEADVANIRFGWAGSLEPRQPHYYRLQGPTFLLEFDNSRNRGTHIHSVWRDFRQDFGQEIV